MCATLLATGPVESASPAFETLLVHLAIESHGLNQSGLFKLFCQAAKDHFGASGVCCSISPCQAGWIVGEVTGSPSWGKPGEALPAAAANWLELAKTAGKAISRPSISTEVLCLQSD